MLVGGYCRGPASVLLRRLYSVSFVLIGGSSNHMPGAVYPPLMLFPFNDSSPCGVG
jgi:hypothetical protein